MAKSRVKGLTIEIGGSTTGLDKALSKMNSEVSNSQAKLRDLNKLLKLDPTNTELLEQKQRTLKDAIGATKDKLEVLKKAQDEAKQALADGNLGQDKYDALQREISETESALKSLQEEAKKVPSALQASLGEASGKLKDISDKVKEVGGKVTDAGKNITMGVTAPIAGVAAGAVTAWKEVDTAMDTVTKKTGASGEQLEDMQQRVKNIAETIPTDFETAGNAVGEVNTRFGVTGDALESLSKQFVEFADLNETDVSTSVDKVQSAMEAWGVQTEDAGLVLDLFNKAGQDTGISVDKLSDMLKTNKTALDEMGFSMSDSAMFLANLDKNGVDAGTAIAGLKKSLQNAAKDGKSSKDVLDELQKSMGEGADKSDAYAAAIEVFGSKAGPAIADAVQEGRLSFEELGTSLQDYAGNVENTFNETLDPMDQLQTSMNTMKDLGAEIVESAAPMISEAMGVIRDVIVELKEKWDGLDDNQKEMIIKIAGIAALVGPVIAVIGILISSIGGVIGAVAGVIGVIGGLTAPIAIAIGAIGLLIAAGVWLYQNWDVIKQKAGELVEGVVKKWEGFVSDTKQKFQNLKDGAVQKFQDLKDGAVQKVQELKDGAVQKVQDLKDGAVQKVQDLKDGAVQKFQDLKDGAVQKVQDLKDGAVQKVQDLKDAAVQKVQDLKDGAVQKFQDLKDGAVQKVQDLKDGAAQKVQDLKDAFEEKFGGIAEKVESAMDGIQGFIEDPIGSAVDFVKNAVENIKNAFNFEWSLPELKLPHITIGGYINVPVFGTIPDPNQIYIDWYAKAMSRGMILDKPTIFGAMDGKLLGGGETGREVVVGANSLQSMIMSAVNSAGGQGTTVNYGGVEIVVNAPQGMDVRALAEEIESRINSNVIRRKAGYA